MAKNSKKYIEKVQTYLGPSQVTFPASRHFIAFLMVQLAVFSPKNSDPGFYLYLHEMELWDYINQCLLGKLMILKSKVLLKC